MFRSDFLLCCWHLCDSSGQPIVRQQRAVAIAKQRPRAPEGRDHVKRQPCTIGNYEACDIHNSEDCLLFTPAGVCSSFFEYERDDDNGNCIYNERFCCPKCDPPLTAEEAEQMRRDYVELYEVALADGRLDEAEELKTELAEIDADTRRILPKASLIVSGRVATFASRITRHFRRAHSSSSICPQRRARSLAVDPEAS